MSDDKGITAFGVATPAIAPKKTVQEHLTVLETELAEVQASIASLLDKRAKDLWTMQPGIPSRAVDAELEAMRYRETQIGDKLNALRSQLQQEHNTRRDNVNLVVAVFAALAGMGGVVIGLLAYLK